MDIREKIEGLEALSDEEKNSIISLMDNKDKNIDKEPTKDNTELLNKIDEKLNGFMEEVTTKINDLTLVTNEEKKEEKKEISTHDIFEEV